MLEKLRSLLGGTEVTHSQYVASWIDLSIIQSEKDLRDAINLHAFDRSQTFQFQEHPEYTRIDYGKEGLAAAYEAHPRKRDFKLIIPDQLLGMPYHEPRPNFFRKLFQVKEPTGFFLGGPVSDISVPYVSQLAAPFQQIATIKPSFPEMDWLPFAEFHIIYPLLTTIKDYLFLDYSDPTAPKVLEDYLDYYPSDYFGPIGASGVIEYEKIHLQNEIARLVKKRESGDWFPFYGSTGIPTWQQDFVLPYCPISGKLMKHVCGIETNGELPLKYTNLNFEGKHKNDNIAHLNFWGSGTLNIFMEPETKIVGMIIQSS